MCPDCEARRQMARDALLRAKLGEAVKQVAIGAVEMIGVKEKTGTDELAAKPNVKPRKR